MTKAKTAEAEDKLADAKRQGQAQFDSIKEMVEELRKADLDAISEGPTEDGNYGDACESARQRIMEDALSVRVHSGWYAPGAERAEQKAEEYEILLCTGGPACRIIGELDEYGEPETACMEVQDWLQPWTQIRPLVSPDDYDSEPILLEYARCFWFGE
jgi:hypothetical protein